MRIERFDDEGESLDVFEGEHDTVGVGQLGVEIELVLDSGYLTVMLTHEECREMLENHQVFGGLDWGQR